MCFLNIHNQKIIVKKDMNQYISLGAFLLYLCVHHDMVAALTSDDWELPEHHLLDLQEVPSVQEKYGG